MSCVAIDRESFLLGYAKGYLAALGFKEVSPDALDGHDITVPLHAVSGVCDVGEDGLKILRTERDVADAVADLADMPKADDE